MRICKICFSVVLFIVGFQGTNTFAIVPRVASRPSLLGDFCPITSSSPYVHHLEATRQQSSSAPSSRPRPLGNSEIAWPTVGLITLLTTCHFAIIASALRNFLPRPLATALLTIVTYFWFTPMHDAVHGSVAGRHLRILNPVVGQLAAAAFLAPYSAFRLLHLEHHAAVNQQGKDPDLWVAGNTRIGVLGRCLSIIPHYYYDLFGKLFQTGVRDKGEIMQAATVLAGFLLGFVALVQAGHGANACALWGLPALLGSGLLSFTFDYLPHYPFSSSGHWTNARVFAGRTLGSERLLTVLMAGQNYHLLHHIDPRIPFYQYRKLYNHFLPELESHGTELIRL